MSDRPSAGELAAAVREFLELEILPTLDDHRLRFRTLVAMNALGIVERESAPPQPVEPGLAQRIRADGIGAADLGDLKAAAVEKLRIASPRTLERYE